MKARKDAQVEPCAPKHFTCGRRQPVYLLRFDDICPTMDWQAWSVVEAIIRDFGLKPIVAVVPDNQDSHLRVAPHVRDFWGRVRTWQRLGWTIALHGYQHLYCNRNAGVMGITPQSEFAGLSYDQQKEKLLKGLQIFEQNGVKCDTWVAPSHSFDNFTLRALSDVGIKLVSDGFASRAFLGQNGLVWIPCQMWDQIAPREHGLWTVCYHHNGWTNERISKFRTNISIFRGFIRGVHDVIRIGEVMPLTWGERLAAWGHSMWRFRVRRLVKSTLLKLKPL